VQCSGAKSPVAESHFAPAARASRAEIEASIAGLAEHPLWPALLDAVDVSVAVLNYPRQILVGNSALFTGLGISGIDAIKGLRPGEALDCIHARECSACGAVLAILESQHSEKPVERDCLMTVHRDNTIDALELHVRASPLTIGTERFTMVRLRDISSEKRREALERVFLHDISNTLSPLLTWSELLAAQRVRNPVNVTARIATLARRLKGDVDEQRVLLQAEKGILDVTRAQIELDTVIEKAITVVEGFSEAKGRSLEVVRCAATRRIVTDESLLVRVLVNMLKNALEATPESGVVRVWAEYTQEACEHRFLRVLLPSAG
jgi:signal transduction histidine kinase